MQAIQPANISYAGPSKIYLVLSKIMGEVGAIGRTGQNELDNYAFRKIDDILNKLQPILVRNGVFIVPTVAEAFEEKSQSEDGSSQIRVRLSVRYQIYADDGSSVSSTVQGEAIDRSDKASNKAMTAAFKQMVTQVFCIAVEGMPDADQGSPGLSFVKEKTPPALARPDHKIGDGKYRGKMVSEIDSKEMSAYIEKMELAAKSAGRRNPKWLADLKKAFE